MRDVLPFLAFGLICLVILMLLGACATPEPNWGGITHVMKDKGI